MSSKSGKSPVLRSKATKKVSVRKTTKRARAARTRLLNAVRGGIALIAGVLLLLFMAGVHIPIDWVLPSKTSALETKLVPAPAKKPKACPSPLSDSTTFSRCPSFWVDFSKEKNGEINKKLFNIVTDRLNVHEAQVYTDDVENVGVFDGNLVISALHKPTQGYQYTSGRIDTHGKEDFLYGKLVVRAKLPSGIGTWPAIWLLPSDNKYAKLGTAAEQARRLNDGEIDIVEAIGSYPHLVYGVTHTILYRQDGIDHTFFNTVTIPDNDTVFHDYAMEWTPTSITISVDGVPYHSYNKQSGATYKQWPFDQPFYLVINLALGGSWAGRNKSVGSDGIDKDALPATLNIQSINYYSYVGPR